VTSLLLAFVLISSDSIPRVPPPSLRGSFALGWAVGGTQLQGDNGLGWGSALRAFTEWHPREALAFRASMRSQEAISPSDRFRSHLVGAGLDGILEWPYGPIRPRFSTGVTAALVSGQPWPLDHRSHAHEDWTLLVPVEVGAEWILGPQVSLQLWGEAQAFTYPNDMLDGQKSGSGYFDGRDELVSGGLALAFRLNPDRDSDHDGISDSRDKCPFQPEDFDGFQDEDGCPDPDNDGDGIPDLRDKCPNQAEDFDGFQDEDGCPDPDNDGDGIPDLRDKCPNQAEDFDGFQDEDGCPDPDNDHDGICDPWVAQQGLSAKYAAVCKATDKCPDQAEDFDGFQDGDGCPDYDNDHDGIPDSLDQCPNEAEDFDGFQDGDGCPDPDNDHDGIPDSLDKCPNVPETINGFQDEDGCPDIALKPSQSMIADRIWFKEGTDEFLPESSPGIQEVAEWLEGDPTARIEVRGYTDDMGSDRVNQILSQKRAEALRLALLAKGVADEQVRSRGFGRLNPIASNRTLDGRARNRRIEIFRYQ